MKEKFLTSIMLSFIDLLFGDMENVTVDVHIKSKEQDIEGQSVKEEVDIKSLTDTELWKKLCSYGVNPGPILRMYQIHDDLGRYKRKLTHYLLLTITKSWYFY